jgi:hypothetical protein
MKNKDLYVKTFSQLHTKADLNIEAFMLIKKRRGHVFRLATAACVCLLVAASSTVYAMNIFGLKDMIISKRPIPSPTVTAAPENTDIAPGDTQGNMPEEAGVTPTDSGMTDPYLSVADLISLQGFTDSEESMAAREWNEFRDNYDTDGTLLAQVGNGPTGLDERYSLYSVYTQEMADKLDEIVNKYNLKLHSSIEIIEGQEKLIEMAGKGNFLGTANFTGGGYMYEDGTFHYDGTAAFEGLIIYYQFMNCKKGSFTDVFLNIGNLEDYKEWSYTTACGVTVRLAISPYKSLVIADMDTSFVTVNVLAGTEFGFLDEAGKITASDLERFADSIDYTLLK